MNAEPTMGDLDGDEVAEITWKFTSHYYKRFTREEWIKLCAWLDADPERDIEATFSENREAISEWCEDRCFAVYEYDPVHAEQVRPELRAWRPSIRHTDQPRARNFYLTFGVQYAREPHPAFPPAHPDGWVRIVAPGYDQARALAVAAVGQRFASLYEEDDWDPAHFPAGEITVLTAEPAEQKAGDRR